MLNIKPKKVITNAVTGALFITGTVLPAAAQSVLYRNHPVTWHRPVTCKTGIMTKTQPSWKEGSCDRVVVSTGGSSHNIRFIVGEVKMVYITSLQNPKEVHHVLLEVDDTMTTIAATGKCVLVNNNVSCSAVADDNSFGMYANAVFADEFPELRSILR